MFNERAKAAARVISGLFLVAKAKLRIRVTDGFVGVISDWGELNHLNALEKLNAAKEISEC